MPEQRVGPGGLLIMAWILLMSIAGAGIPMIAGVGLVALIPGLGELNQPFPWIALHVLWMYPVLWLVGTVIDSVGKHLVGGRPLGRFGTLVDGLITWCVMTLVFTVMLSDPLGAMLAALIAALLMKPFADWLERHIPDEDHRDDPQQSTG